MILIHDKHHEKDHLHHDQCMPLLLQWTMLCFIPKYKPNVSSKQYRIIKQYMEGCYEQMCEMSQRQRHWFKSSIYDRVLRNVTQSYSGIRLYLISVQTFSSDSLFSVSLISHNRKYIKKNILKIHSVSTVPRRLEFCSHIVYHNLAWPNLTKSIYNLT